MNPRTHIPDERLVTFAVIWGPVVMTAIFALFLCATASCPGSP